MSEYNQDHEDEANQFAIELLVPTAMFTHSLNEVFPSGLIDIENDGRIGQLAEMYQVSKQLILFRIGQVKKW